MLAGSKLTNKLSRSTSRKNCSSVSARSWPVSRCNAWRLPRQCSQSWRVTTTASLYDADAAIVRHETQMQGHDVALQRSREIGDLAHLVEPRGPRRRRHQADRAHHRRNIGVAFAFESAEHGRQPNAERREPIQEPAGDFGRPSPLVRRMQLDRRHAQFMRHVEIHAQAGVDTGEHTQRPFS